MTLQSDEGPTFYQRSLRASVVMGLLATLFTTVYAGARVSTAYVAPLAWMLVNLVLWGRAVREILGRRRGAALFALMTLKVVWLAALVALAGWLDVGSERRYLFAFLLGFNTPFLVMCLKAVGGVLAGGAPAPGRETSGGSMTDESLDR